LKYDPLTRTYLVTGTGIGDRQFARNTVTVVVFT